VRLPESDESPVLRAFAEGRLTPDAAFDGLYRAFGPTTRAWLAVRTTGADVDDLLQDVWSIFWRRWVEWRPPDGVSPADPRPVLSFLFRTCHLTLLAHRRLAGAHAVQPIDALAEPAVDGQLAIVRDVQLGECLTAARACGDDIDLAVLSAKLSGISGRETAGALGITEAAVDHRYRAMLARIRERLTPPQCPQESPHGE
jgi:DNA-directed RNA polymerase specialized sigma24 family protein